MEDQSREPPADLPEKVGKFVSSAKTSTLKEELDAIGVIGRALESLDFEARERAVNLIVNRFGLRAADPHRPFNSPKEARGGGKEVRKPRSDFEDIGALYEAAHPQSDPERALIAAYWFQVVEGQSEFGSQPLNDALKNLGNGVENITKALDRLKERQPSLIRQVQKSGSSKQARKLYKVTDAGIKAVREMIEGGGTTGQ